MGIIELDNMPYVAEFEQSNRGRMHWCDTCLGLDENRWRYALAYTRKPQYKSVVNKSGFNFEDDFMLFWLTVSAISILDAVADGALKFIDIYIFLT